MTYLAVRSNLSARGQSKRTSLHASSGDSFIVFCGGAERSFRARFKINEPSAFGSPVRSLLLWVQEISCCVFVVWLLTLSTSNPNKSSLRTSCPKTVLVPV
ncbi:hypothetical protein L596_011567 [Steinernema carpocapsae]|uniref:Uncharacterized protein n=1 Tax=Steinernema carpocapsae TaxID=34508 RepID=A0A4U5NUB8_STECR|nr:hypothetical protein L596_011567 [Steinernema carpocapsae]